jgi:hypothetical protein
VCTMPDVIRFPRWVKRNPDFHQHPTSEDRRWRKRRGGGNPWSKVKQRRYEIEQCAVKLSAVLIDEVIDGEIVRRYFEQFLIAWSAHNRKSKDPVGDLMAAAVRMGGPITKAEARAAVDQAEDMPHYWKADDLAHYLGIFYDVRQDLKLKTIGSVDIGKKARKELRKREARLRKERKRRERGAKSRAQYEAEALLNTRPWAALGISRRTWERRRRAGPVASPSAVTPTPTRYVASPAAVPPKGGRPTDGPASAGIPQEAVRGGACNAIGVYRMFAARGTVSARATIWRGLQGGARAMVLPPSDGFFMSWPSTPMERGSRAAHCDASEASLAGGWKMNCLSLPRTQLHAVPQAWAL